MTTEAQTRKELIDSKLRQAGWDVNNLTQVVPEFDISVSLPEEVVEKPLTPYAGHQYSDYVLLGRDGKPLAVVEAKKTSKDPAIGREQAKQYCYNIQRQSGGKLPFCFYTNGLEIYFWDLDNYPPRKVVGFPSRDDLERFQYIREHKKPLADELINTRIAGRDYQVRAIRAVMEGIAELVAPQLGHSIADPACGTGGFLLGAYQYMVTQLDKNRGNIQPDEDGFIRNSVSSLLTKEVSDTLNNSLYGYDFDVTMVRLGLMNLMMHGVDTPHIDYKDTLSKGFSESNRYNIVMANPPFTGSIDKGDINESLRLSTTKTELLFVEQIYNLLKMGGTAGVIVPQGVLFGSGNAFVEARKILIEKCELKAVITMPSGVFKPYAGVSTAILIFTKGGETENVWFYDMQSDGYSLDDKRTKLEGYGDLKDIVEQFKKRNPQNESNRKTKFFFVPKAEIAAEGYDLSMSKYKEDVFEEVPYEKPAVILARLKTMEGEISQELNELDGMVG